MYDWAVETFIFHSKLFLIAVNRRNVAYQQHHPIHYLRFALTTLTTLLCFRERKQGKRLIKKNIKKLKNFFQITIVNDHAVEMHPVL